MLSPSYFSTQGQMGVDIFGVVELDQFDDSGVRIFLTLAHHFHSFQKPTCDPRLQVNLLQDEGEGNDSDAGCNRSDNV